jgi:hypothetical protein
MDYLVGKPTEMLWACRLCYIVKIRKIPRNAQKNICTGQTGSYMYSMVMPSYSPQHFVIFINLSFSKLLLLNSKMICSCIYRTMN